MLKQPFARHDADAPAAAPAASDPSIWRPSEYTGFLINAVLAATAGRSPRRVLEIGVGSGAVLASLAGSGATSLTGTDVDPRAIAETQRLMDSLG